MSCHVTHHVRALVTFRITPPAQRQQAIAERTWPTAVINLVVAHLEAHLAA
jgi:hypothetical protein